MRERLGRSPQRQAPPAAQARLILRPVRRVVRHLRNVMPAVGVVLARHTSASERLGRHSITHILSLTYLSTNARTLTSWMHRGIRTYERAMPTEHCSDRSHNGFLQVVRLS